ncbi:MAG TPA: hypothetical protein VGH19_16120 [Verrucomicrobiae bacterium]
MAEFGGFFSTDSESTQYSSQTTNTTTNNIADSYNTNITETHQIENAGNTVVSLGGSGGGGALDLGNLTASLNGDPEAIKKMAIQGVIAVILIFALLWAFKRKG